MKKIYIIALFLFAYSNLFAQANTSNKFQINIDYHYFYGLNEKGDNYNINRNIDKMHGNSLRLSALYSISNKTDLGLGFGSDVYENPEYTTFPIFGTLHYFPFIQNRHPYIYTNFGYAINSKISNPGVMLDLGLGYKKMLKKNLGVKMEFGYNLKDIQIDLLMNNTKVGTTSRIRNSLSMGFGILF